MAKFITLRDLNQMYSSAIKQASMSSEECEHPSKKPNLMIPICNNYSSETVDSVIYATISPTEKHFPNSEVSGVIEDLVMTRYGSDFLRKKTKSMIRRSRPLSNRSLDDDSDTYASPSSYWTSSDDNISVATHNLSDLMSVQSSCKEDIQRKQELQTVTEYYLEPTIDPITKQLSEENIKKNQLLKALDLDDEYNKGTLSDARIEAEKILVLTGLRHELLINELEQRLHRISTQAPLQKAGSIEISNLELKSPAFAHMSHKYFVCFLSNGCSVFPSDVIKTNSRNLLRFQKSFYFSALPPNFTIDIKIYSMTIKKKRQFAFIRDNYYCYNMNETTFMDNTDGTRESLFKFWGETTLQMSNIDDSGMQECGCKTNNDIFALKSNQFHLSCDISKKVNIDLSLSGFLDISSQNCNGCHLWNKYWCVLNGTTLKYWAYPLDEMHCEPLKVIDLEKCIYVRIPTENECVRKKSLIMDIEQGSEVISYYISTWSRIEFDKWKQYLECIVEALHDWQGIN